MNGTVFTAIVSAVATLIVAEAVKYYFIRKGGHEADWRKLKLAHYKEYVAALSGTTRKDSDDKAFLRYSDAADNLALVAPTDVLNALNALHDASKSGKTEDLEALRSSLMRAMRKDCHLKDPKDDSELMFKGIELRTIVTKSEREQL
jgi:hypothetical protein